MHRAVLNDVDDGISLWIVSSLRPFVSTLSLEPTDP